MKRIVRILFVVCVALASLASSCHPEPPDPPGPEPPPTPPDPTPPVVIIDTIDDIPGSGATITLKLVASDKWRARVSSGGDWCTLQNASGPAGEAEIIIAIAPNDTDMSRKCEILLTMGSTEGKIVITQLPKDRLEVSPSEYEADCDGGQFTPEINANIDYEVTVSEDWITWEEGVLTVAENPEYEPRSATVTFSGGDLAASISITQKGQPLPADEVDGVVTMLQTHTEGAGIPLVFMGDAFSEDEIKEGTYATLMEGAQEAFFSVEPYTTFRDLFDVYMVNVVSDYYEDFTVPESTTLGTYFGSGTFVGGDLDKCREYLLRAINEDALDNALAVILLNREYHAGRCYMSFVKYGTGDVGGEGEETESDCARGVAYAFLSLGIDGDDFTGLVQHEACGHGFGKLADEYFYDGMGTIPTVEADSYRSLQTLHHAYMNVDFTSEEENVIWSHFLADERYQYDNLGVFEGGCLYPSGVYRSSENSIMNDNVGMFNAPSREAIYYRLHKLAYGIEWMYDYEAFAAYDAINRTPAPEEDTQPTPVQTGKKIRTSRRLAP